MEQMIKFEDVKVGLIGLGYVGLPLAVEFGKKFDTIGYDINSLRISQLINGYDSTQEMTCSELKQTSSLTYTCDTSELEKCNVYIVTVPTPIDKYNQPDLTPLLESSKMIGKVITEGDVVIFESTVYPGATEDDCIPVIENISGLLYNKNFFAGYSPERINPGDKEHRVTNILKVTSGSNQEVADFVDKLYGSIIKAGTFKASSIRVAEASKVIENVQRDVNIALINELHQIFTKLGIDTNDVIEAASTKWNFMKLKPGLVGGHCISVDPYYLLHKSISAGYIPDLMQSAREINDGMSTFICNEFMRHLVKGKIDFVGKKILIMGFTFKENCPDIRNTKVYDLYRCLKELSLDVEVYDPLASRSEVKSEYSVELVEHVSNDYAGAILAVNHEECEELTEKLLNKGVYVYKIR
jgi:UDP-N-acetyl-D-galactosamine dehydrogenase